MADLHLEKASFYARSGQMLPPYDSRETLERLALAIRETGARRVYTLGDNFHDDAGPERLEPHAAGMLAALTRATRLGVDHRQPRRRHGGEARAARWPRNSTSPACCCATAPRPARRGPSFPAISTRACSCGSAIARSAAPARWSAAASCGERMILPRFGALTGGMNAADPAILQALQPAGGNRRGGARQDKLATFPLWRRAA